MGLITKTFYNNKPGTGLATFYTVPASKKVIITRIRIVPSAAVDGDTVTITIAGQDLLKDYMAFNANKSPYVEDTAIVLIAGQAIEGLQSNAAGYTLQLAGYEEDA